MPNLRTFVLPNHKASSQKIKGMVPGREDTL
jgi:hypothetical protein